MTATTEETKTETNIAADIIDWSQVPVVIDNPDYVAPAPKSAKKPAKSAPKRAATKPAKKSAPKKATPAPVVGEVTKSMISKCARGFKKAGKAATAEEIAAFTLELFTAGVPILKRSSSRIAKAVKGDIQIADLLD